MTSKKAIYKKISIGIIICSIIFLTAILARLPNKSNNFSIFRQKLSSLCWVTYAPTHFNPREGVYPSDYDIKEDLTVLNKAGFNGIVTFGSEKSLRKVPEIAKEVGFKGVIMGIWDINSREEIENAIKAKAFVDGYCVGHMGLNKNYDFMTLEKTISIIKEKTEKFITTTESIRLYLTDSRLTRIVDWIFPEVCWYWEETKRTPIEFFKKILESYQKLIRLYEKPILIKTIGFPTAGDVDASEENQSELFRLLLKNARYPYERIRFVYFEGFDQPWKTWHAIEPHWGIFKNDRYPKPGAIYIWGKNVFYPFYENLKKENLLSVKKILIPIVAIILFFSLFYYYINAIMRKRQKNKINLIKKDKKILRNYKGEEISLNFDKKHNECFDILSIFVENEDKALLCGEIIHKTNEKGLIKDCLFDSDNGCNQKKEYCRSYSMLNTHRIGTVRKLLRKYNIGDIVNIQGESRWKLKLENGIKVNIID